MILASQAQKDAPKVVQPTAQVNINAAQIDSSAFNLLLAFVNTGANESAEAAVDFADDSGTDSPSDDLGKDLLADQAALPAKIADWLASNPASLAALRGLASGAGGLSAPEGSELLLNALGSGNRGQQIKAALDLGAINPQVQALLLKLALAGQTLSSDGAAQGNLGAINPQVQALLSKLALAGQALASDGAAKGIALVSAIEQASDSQSMAAALMAAVSAGLGKVTDSSKALGSLQSGGLGGKLSERDAADIGPPVSSNLILARNTTGDASLDDLLPQGLALGGSQLDNGMPSSAGRTGSDAGGFGSADSIGSSGNLTEAASRSAERSDPALTTAEISVTDEQKQRQLEQGDALLATNLLGSSQGLDGLQQAMSAQTLGRALITNANALEGTVSWLSSQQGGSATIDLSPPELGSLRLELKIDAAGESAVLIVHAANEAAKAAIEQSLDRLYESFQSSGMALQVSVGSGSSQFAGMFSNGFDDRSRQIQGLNRSPDGERVGAIATTSRAAGVATDALSLYA